MALPVLAAVGIGLLGGAISGGISNSRDRRAGERNLANSKTQAALYELRIDQLRSVASSEAGDLFERAAEVKGDRLSSQAARGISLDSQVVESFNIREREVLLSAVNATVANAAMEASSFRTEGRMGMQAARQALDEIRSRRSNEIVLGAFTGAFNVGTSLVSNWASRT